MSQEYKRSPSICCVSSASFSPAESIEKLRSDIIALSQDYSDLITQNLEARGLIGKVLEECSIEEQTQSTVRRQLKHSSSRIIFRHGASINSEAAAAAAAEAEEILSRHSYTEDALSLKRRCFSFPHCSKHVACRKFQKIVTDYRALDKRASLLLDLFDEIRQKSSVCVVEVLVDKLYAQKLKLETYFE